MPTVTLPKVAQYVMNVGKSVKLASIDYFAEATPGISDFLETNSDLFKEIYSSAINYKDSVKRAHTGIKQSKIYEAVDTARKALFEDLKTGNFYNKEREEAMGMKGLDMEMDDMEFDPSMMDFSDDDDSDAAKQSRAFERATEVASKAQADVTVRSADMVAGTVKASSSMIIAQNERIMASMTSGMANIHAAVSGVGKYLEGPMLSHMQNTKLYQENSLKYQEQITKQLDELLQMQRNLYNAQQEVAASSNKDITLDDIISFEGNPDLTEYGKKIYKNLANALGPEVGMLLGDSFGKNSNPLLMLAGAPLKFIPEYLVKTVVPTTVTKMLEAFDKSISGVFTTMISRFNTWASDDNDNLFTSLLGKLLGVKVERQTSVDPSNFKRGPIPFDGVTKQAIVEIIPGYLRRIESALTGQSERIYNMNSGKWTNIKAIEKEFKDRQEAAVTMSTRDMMQPIFDYINQLKSQTYNSERSRDEANEKIKELTDAVDTLSHKIYNDKGYFRGYKSSYDRDSESYISAAEYYGIDPEVYKEMMGLISGRAGSDSPSNIRNRGNVMHVAQETMSQIASWNQFLKRSEEEYGPIMQLFNNSYDVNLSKRYDPNQKIGAVGGGILGNVLVNSVDEYDKNIFFYLRNIYSIMLADQENGGIGGRGGRPSGGGPRPAIPRTRRTITPEEAFKNLINKDKKEEQKQAQLKVDTERGTSYEDTTENIELQKIIEEKLRTEQQGYTDPEKTFIGQFRKATNFSEKFKAVKDSFDLLTKKPALAITSMLDTADRKIYEMLFGKEDMLDAEERFGKKPGGIVEHMVYRIEETFDKLDDWFREHVFDRVKKWMDDAGITEKVDRAKEWLKDKFRWEDIKGSFRNKLGFAKDQFTGAFKSVGSDIMNSRAYQNYHIRNYTRRTPTAFVGRDIETDTESGSYGDEDAIRTDYGSGLYNKFDYDGSLIQEDDENVQSFARGTKLVTKRGLAIVSPGETIIPATLSKVGQARQLAKEKAFARRFGIKNANFYAEGTATAERETDSPTGVAQTTTEEDYEKVKQTIKTVAKEIAPRESLVDIAVNGLIGSGVSLITGMVGGPLLGAAVGAGVGVVKNSQTVREALFGSEFIDEEGNVIEKKGLISKKLQNNFKKYFPDMKNYGIVGAVAGLFTPLGLVGGLMAGSALGFLKNNDRFQTYLFGEKGPDGERDGGLISKEFRKKVSEAAPRMLVGAAGGALLGPFGLLGNVALGSALGFVSTTDKFHEMIFGSDENGKHKDGLLDALRKGFVIPMMNFGKNILEEGKKFFQVKVFKPLGDFVDPAIQMIKNGIVGFFDFLKERSIKGLDKYIGRPLSDFLQHTIFESVAKWTKRALSIPFNVGKAIVAAPFQALGFLGNNIRSSQITKGTAGDMSAQERLNWRDQHKFRMFGKEIAGHDKFKSLDQKLANMQGQEGIERMKQLRDQMKIFLDTRKVLGEEIADLVRRAGEIVSNFFNRTSIPSDPSIMAYTAIGSRNIKKIHEAIRDGRMDRIEKIVNQFVVAEFITADQAAELLNQLSPLVAQIAEGRERQANASEYRQELMNKLGAQSGGTLNNIKNIRRFSRLLDTEIKVREREEAANAEAEEAKSPEEQALTGMSEIVDTNTKRMIEILTDINEAIRFNNMTPEEKKDYLANKAKEGEQETKTPAEATEKSVSALDDLLSGSARDATTTMDKSYHTVETPDGAQALADSSGNILPSSAAARVKKYIKDQEDEKKESKTFRERLHDSLFGKAIGKATDIIGGAKDGLFGLFSKYFDQFSTVGNIIKWVFLGGTAIAATGHASGWLKDSVFPWLKEHVAPWLIGTRNEDGVLQGGIRGAIFGNKNEYGEYEGGIISGTVNWFKTTPIWKFFESVYDIYKTKGFIGFVEPIIDWYASGTSKFMSNVVEPLVEAFVKRLPQLVTAIGKGVWNAIKSWVSGDAEFEEDSEGNQIVTNTKTGRTASKIENADGTISYRYTDGTVETDPNADFTINRSGDYAKQKESIGGLVGAGISNNLLAGLAGYGPATTKIPTFAGKSIMKNVENFAKGGIIRKAFNATSGLFKGAWNSAANVGNVSRNLGNAIATSEDGTNVISKLINGTKEAAEGAAGVAADVATEAAETGTKTSIWSKIGNLFASTADDAPGLLSKVKNGIISFFEKLGSNSTVIKLFKTVAKVFNTTIDDALVAANLKKAGEKLAIEAGENLSKSALKSAANALAVIPIATIVLAAIYFVNGWNNAHNIFGIAKDIDIPMCYNIIAGLVNAVKNALPGFGVVLGFVPTSTIINLFVDTLFPLFGWDNENLKEMREETERLMDEYNATLPEDEQVTSVEEYNEKANPGLLTRISNTVKSWFGGDSGSSRSSTSTSGADKISSSRTALDDMRDSIKAAREGEFQSGSRRSGTAHVYQKARDLANQKFGNSTIGEAGCGPVAATNLINKMGGRMDVGTAASYAESGGFIDSATGGTTTDYMSSILNKSGIPSRETTNKQDIYNNLKQGKPVVMLGNSGMESGTPFGANDHYITAMGLDRQGNVIAEDPDLPDAYRKYKASRVMKDVDIGIATGASRYYGKKRPGSTRFGNKYAAKRRRKSGRALMVNTVMSDGGGGSASAASDVVYNWAFRAADCIGDGESSGNYAAINKNDSGNGMSVGKYQFHRGKAKVILTDIANYLVTYGVYTFDSLKELLGQNLYDYVTASALSDYRYYPNDAEIEALKTILDSDVGHERQDYKMVNDAESLYLPRLKKLGLSLEKQEDIIIYFCNTLHMMGEGSEIPSNIINAAKKSTGKAVGDLTLDDIHTAMMASDHGKGRKTRYEKNYNFLKATSPGGVSSSYYDDINSDTSSSYSSIMEGVSEANSEAIANADENPGILSMLGNAIKQVFRNIYGGVVDQIFGWDSSDSTSFTGSSTGTTSSSRSNTNGAFNGSTVASGKFNANSAQKALPAWMKSIEGKIAYSTSGVQDPDQGQASCASTVEWAYRKALGLPENISDLAYQSMYDNLNRGFEYVYKSETPASAYGGSDFSLKTDLPKLQAGDILYYRTKDAAGYLNRPMGIGHVEMYDGEGHRVGHGSGYGPKVKDISSNASNLVAALRYGPFIDGAKIPFTNPDGTPGVYESDTKMPAANQFTTHTMAAMGRNRGGIANKARKNLYKKYKGGKKITEADIKNYMEFEASDDSGITGNSRYSIQRSGIARTPTLSSAVSYEDFLNVIIELLTIIAKNSDKLSEIVTLLSKSGVNVSKTDIVNAGSSRSAEARLKDAIRRSGLGKSSISSAPGKSHPYGGSADERDPNDIQYVVGLMESLAKS